MTLFGSKKNLIDKRKNDKISSSFEVAERDLKQCNLVDNEHHQKHEVL